MVDSGREVDFGWFERVIGGEMYGKEEDSSRVWTVSLYRLSESHDREGLVYSRVPLWLLASETVPRTCISIPKAVQGKSSGGTGAWEGSEGIVPGRHLWALLSMMKVGLCRGLVSPFSRIAGAGHDVESLFERMSRGCPSNVRMLTCRGL